MSYNPFREKAIRARKAYERIAGVTTAHDRGMAQSFPLGAGYGRTGGERRIEARVNRAVKACAALEEAQWREAQADAFDAGKINAQGRRWDARKQAISEKREAAKEKRDARIAAAREACAGKQPWECPKDVWCDATGYLAGGGRALIEHDYDVKCEGHI